MLFSKEDGCNALVLKTDKPLKIPRPFVCRNYWMQFISLN